MLAQWRKADRTVTGSIFLEFCPSLWITLALGRWDEQELVSRPVYPLHFRSERLRRIVATRRQYERVARSIKDIPPSSPPVIPETSIKEINPLLLFAGCRAGRIRKADECERTQNCVRLIRAGGG